MQKKLIIATALACSALVLPAVATEPGPHAAPRRPVALTAAGRWIFVANQRSGSISVIDAQTQTVVDETHVGGRLADLALIPGSSGWLLATDESRNRLVILKRAESNLRVVDHLDLPPSPVQVAIAPGGRLASVASTWARRLTLIELVFGTDAPLHLRRRAQIDLPFAPRLQTFGPNGRTLVVTGAFDGSLAVVDADSGRLQTIRRVEGHNIRGLSFTPDARSILLAQMKIESHLPATREMIAGGYLVGNFLRRIELRHLLKVAPGPRADPLGPVPVAHWSLEPLGKVGDSTGDPGEILTTEAGGLAICLSGVHEVGLRRRPGDTLQRVRVGRGPVALAPGPNGRHLYVANRFDDTVSVIDWDRQEVIRTIALGKPAPATDADRGEQLFFDATLSVHGWLSCHSCHPDGHAADFLSDTLGDETIETPKRILSLLGTADTGPWAWNGSQDSLEKQVHKSLRQTLCGDEHHARGANVRALAAFLRTLPPPPSVDVARAIAPDADAIARGQSLFRDLDCTRCHRRPAFTAPRTYDVGLEDERGMHRFSPPSLRAISQGARFLHDGRATTLRAVFSRHHHEDAGGEGDRLRPGQLDDLLRFLRRL